MRKTDPSVGIEYPPREHETYIHEAPDGTLRAYDVTVANQRVQDGREMLLFSLIDHEVTLEKIHELYEGLDEEYALTTDLTKPLLFLPLGEETLLVDGWHRLAKAAILGIPELPIYLLSQADADAIQWLELPPGHGLLWK